MPDISMCEGYDCSRKENCYRFKAKPSNWQSYIRPEKTGEECGYYWRYEKVVEAILSLDGKQARNKDNV